VGFAVSRPYSNNSATSARNTLVGSFDVAVQWDLQPGLE
jgi:hypothetical protein